MMVRISAWGSFVLVAIAIGTFLMKDRLIVSINMLLAAFCLVPIIPVSIDFATELTFPIEETVCTGFLLMAAQAFGFVLAIIVLQLSLFHAVYGLGLIVICALIAAILSLFIQGDLRRVSFTDTQNLAIQRRRESLNLIKSQVETTASNELSI
jgi:FLVCR family feline leukemia virus subgroup C receptor-related protein